MPSVYQAMPEGEKIVIRAFFEQEMAERKEKNEALADAAKKGFFCPSMLG